MRTSIHDLVITEEEGTGLARLLSESDQKKWGPTRGTEIER